MPLWYVHDVHVASARHEAWHARQSAMTPLLGTPGRPHSPKTLFSLNCTAPPGGADTFFCTHASARSGSAPDSTGASPGNASKRRPLSAAPSAMVAFK